MTNLSLKIKTTKLIGQKNQKTGIVQKSKQNRTSTQRVRILEIDKVGSRAVKKVSMPQNSNIQTEYQAQYKAKQLIKKYYGGLQERELKNAPKGLNIGVIGQQPKNWILELEKRLDVVLFRLGFANSILEGRSLIKEGQVFINDKLVNPTAYNLLIKIGSKITIKPIKEKNYLARIQHIKFGFIQLPTHLILSGMCDMGHPLGTSSHNKPQASLSLVQSSNPLLFNSFLPLDVQSTQLEGYFIKEPIESEILYPFNFPINKLRMAR